MSELTGIRGGNATGNGFEGTASRVRPGPYTHLTRPTNREGSTYVVVGTLKKKNKQRSEKRGDTETKYKSAIIAKT